MINDVQVNGNSGKYDNKVADSSVRYARNAVDNHAKYMESPITNGVAPAPILNFSPTAEASEENIQKLEKFVAQNDAELRALPPLEYEYRYMPNIVNGQIDKKALLGAAYEEMGAKEYTVKEFEEKYLADDSMTAEPLDINKDGKIDVAEYGANILAADVLSKGTTDPNKVDGTVNSRGFNAILAYTQKANAAAASKLYTSLYNTHGLAGEAAKFSQYN